MKDAQKKSLKSFAPFAIRIDKLTVVRGGSGNEKTTVSADGIVVDIIEV